MTGQSNAREAVRNPVPNLVCHCFGYAARDIEADIARHGRSTILERILEAKRHGTCDCARKNPTGR